MNLDPGIICFEHCRQGKLFSLQLPNLCQLCKADLTKDPLLVPPFRLPYPFVRASQTPSCVLIKPSRGDFLHDYRNSHDLHIGVTDSDCKVYEYDNEGLHSDYTTSWSQCLAIPLLASSTKTLDPLWQEYWDFTLHSIAGQNRWTEERYHEGRFNCYTFILEFLRALQHPSLPNVKLCKTNFCSNYIIPHTSTAARYISIYRRIIQDNVAVVPNASNNNSDGHYTTTDAYSCENHLYEDLVTTTKC